MDYGKILERSWKLTWGNKYLWVLGFLAALGRVGSSSGGGGNSNFSFSGDEFGDVPELFSNIGLLVGLGVFVFLLGIIIWLLSTVARGGLIAAVARIEAGEKPTLGEAFAAGTKKLGTLIGMNLLLYGPFIVLTVVLLVLGGILGLSALSTTVPDIEPIVDPEAIMASLGILVACITGLICLLSPLGLVAMFIQAFSFRGIMLQEMGVVESIKHGWQILRENFAEIFLLGLLFLLISILFSVAVLIVLIPVGLLVMAPFLVTVITGGVDFSVGMIAYLVGGLICLGVLGAILNSVITVWQSSAFTMAYMQFTEKKSLKAA